jgi:hypothetical protein
VRYVPRSFPAVEAPDADAAWNGLLGLGWVHYVAAVGWRGYARCPACVASKETVADAVRAASRSRRWK